MHARLASSNSFWPRRRCRFLALQAFHFSSFHLSKKRQGGKNATLSEGFLLVASRRVLLTLNTYGNRWVPHMDHDFNPSRRAWRPDDAVSHGWLACPMSSSTFCGALTPGTLQFQIHCMPKLIVLCNHQWLTTQSYYNKSTALSITCGRFSAYFWVPESPNKEGR